MIIILRSFIQNNVFRLNQLKINIHNTVKKLWDNIA